MAIVAIPLLLAAMIADLVFCGGIVGTLVSLLPSRAWNKAFDVLGVDAEV